jgi:large subunit ribosomal protein L30
MLQVKLVRSPIGNTKRNRATVAALGLRKMHQTVVLPDNASVRGMIFKVKHMLAVEEVEGGERKASTPKRARTGGAKAGAPQAKAAPKPKAQSPEPEVKRAEKPKAEAKPKAQSKVEGQRSMAEGTKEAKPKAKSPKPKAQTKAPAKKKENA